RGVEPIHATVAVVGGKAVGFLGDCGAGKSTLGAAFLAMGYPILTDDLLALERSRAGYTGHPGMSRLKLFPRVARALRSRVRGARMNPGTAKLILPLAPTEAASRPASLQALYVLARPARRPGRIEIEPLAPTDAFLEV